MEAQDIREVEKIVVATRESVLIFTVLTLACICGFMTRLFAVIRFEIIIHDFDPWFNYRCTAYMVQHGFYNFLNWFDERAWYPLGRIVGGTVYPGLMITSGGIHYILHSLNIPVHIRDICVFLAPTFSGLTAIATYLLTKELWSPGAGLFAACFIAIVPGYTSRSVAGSYDNEGIAIFALQLTYYLWVKSVKSGSVFWSCMIALSYFYMVSAWGGYVFIINLIPLHVFTLLLMGRYSDRLFTSYTTFYILGLLLSMQIPFVGFQPIRTSEHMAATGVFALIMAMAILRYIQTVLSKDEFKNIFAMSVLLAAALVFFTVVALTYAGVIAPLSGRFYSLWDTGYAKIHIPIIASVSEHQPTTWFSFLFNLHFLVCTFPAGLWYCIKIINNERVFVVLYALSAVYFAGVMARLMLTLTPVVCVLSGIAFSHLLEFFLKEEENPRASCSDSEEDGGGDKPSRRMYDKAGKLRKMKHEQQKVSDGLGVNIRSIIIFAVLMLLVMFAVHCTWVTSNAYSSPSIVLASYSQDGSRQILDDFREAYYWLSQNTPHDARVMSWWDYGYQIAGMANRTTLVDNNTWNNSHIALVGKAMSSNESESYKIMVSVDVDYVLVIFGGTVLAAYISFGVEASHIITASIMSAPAALCYAKLFYPETEKSKTRVENMTLKKGDETGLLDAATKGAMAGTALVLGITANIIAFVAAVEFLNGIISWLAQLVGSHDIDFKERSEAIATYALCGFSNPGSIGILIAALSTMAPHRRSDITQVAVRAFIAGCTVCFLTACIAGLLITEENATDNLSLNATSTMIH